MPNTLAHLGIQTFCSKAIIPKADFKWIALGCIVPDLPWIVQRIIRFAGLGVDLYDLRLYCIVQASLAFCLLVAAAVSLQVRDSGKIFLLLLLNCIFHLFLDASQLKWANGIHLFAPFSWDIINFGLYWPESIFTYVLTALGLLAALIYSWRDFKIPVIFHINSGRQLTGILLLLMYFLLPLAFMAGAQEADNHFVDTLRKTSERVGKSIAFDRAGFRADEQIIVIFTGERIKVRGLLPRHDAVLSLRGKFIKKQAVNVAEYHVHSWLRDLSAVLGLCLAALPWLLFLYLKKEQLPGITVE